jgi:hypothetical protein
MISLPLTIPQLKPSPWPFVLVVIPLLEESPTSMVHCASLSKNICSVENGQLAATVMSLFLSAILNTV